MASGARQLGSTATRLGQCFIDDSFKRPPLAGKTASTEVAGVLQAAGPTVGSGATHPASPNYNHRSAGTACWSVRCVGFKERTC